MNKIKAVITHKIVSFILLATLVVSIIFSPVIYRSMAQDNKAKSYSLTQQEKQTFTEIYQRLELAATQKALAETKMQLEQERFDKAVAELKKNRGCEGCTFDAGRLELVAPVEKKDEKVKP